MSQPTDLEVRVQTLRHEANDVVSVELVPYGARPYPLSPLVHTSMCICRMASCEAIR